MSKSTGTLQAELDDVNRRIATIHGELKDLIPLMKDPLKRAKATACFEVLHALFGRAASLEARIHGRTPSTMAYIQDGLAAKGLLVEDLAGVML